LNEYEKRKKEYKTTYGIDTFERFADIFLKEMFDKLDSARKILTW
jgi:hypothetical protein